MTEAALCKIFTNIKEIGELHMNYFESTNGTFLPDEDPPIVEIYDLLYQLGAVADHCGFFYTSLSVWLAVREPERMELITKWLYLDVARHYRTTWKAVEVGIRGVVNIVWEKNPGLLSEWAGCELTSRPSVSQFIAILASRMEERNAQTEESRV